MTRDRKTETKRRGLRMLGVVGVLLATQLLSACIVLPVGGGYYRRGYGVEPGYGHPHGDPYWRH